MSRIESNVFVQTQGVLSLFGNDRSQNENKQNFLWTLVVLETGAASQAHTASAARRHTHAV